MLFLKEAEVEAIEMTPLHKDLPELWATIDALRAEAKPMRPEKSQQAMLVEAEAEAVAVEALMRLQSQV